MTKFIILAFHVSLSSSFLCFKTKDACLNKTADFGLMISVSRGEMVIE
jgi:hypothetical protein